MILTDRIWDIERFFGTEGESVVRLALTDRNIGSGIATFFLIFAPPPPVRAGFADRYLKKKPLAADLFSQASFTEAS
jgi:hypothetical protein